jgi:hypothetical protein
MQQKNLQSTKPIAASLPIATSLDVKPAQENQNARTHAVFATVLPSSNLHKSYSDQTGKFPVQFSRGYNYVMVLYNYDSNAILSKPIKTRQASELTQTWTALHSRLQSNGYAPDLHILDNECSDKLKKALKKTPLTSNAFPFMFTVETLPSAQSKPGRIISALGSQHATPNSRSPNGVSSCRKPTSR